ncbi:hypothetical protein GYH30_051638 [Glycine max]|uniref:Uncharacterized protein n=1 Tax=Glycine max TaxID=3847 RepID=A0A0R0ER38_SOYBN|nr:hypothetical protein GYH30_051638 [Glycine max]
MLILSSSYSLLQIFSRFCGRKLFATTLPSFELTFIASLPLFLHLSYHIRVSKTKCARKHVHMFVNKRHVLYH